MEDFIQTIKVLDFKDLKIINDYVDELNFSPCTVFSGNEECAVNTSTRSSLGVTMDDNHPATVLLNQKLNDALWKYRAALSKVSRVFEYYPVPGGYNTYSHREGIQILEYSIDQEYKFHHDVADEKNRREYHRQISVVLYLNDDFAGGGTEFIHKTYKPSPGYALIFPSNWCFPHSGQRVLSGKKRVAVTWYYIDLSS